MKGKRKQTRKRVHSRSKYARSHIHLQKIPDRQQVKKLKLGLYIRFLLFFAASICVFFLLLSHSFFVLDIVKVQGNDRVTEAQFKESIEGYGYTRAFIFF